MKPKVQIKKKTLIFKKKDSPSPAPQKKVDKRYFAKVMGRNYS